MSETLRAVWVWPSVRVPGVALVLILLTVVFSLIAPGFATLPNLANVLSQASVLLLLAIPMTLIIMTEGLDLSMGAVLTLASMVFAATAVASGSIGLAALAGLAVGLIFGFVNGALVAFVALPPFVVTLGTLGVAQGLALVVTDGQPIAGLPDAIASFYSGHLVGIPIPIVVGFLAYCAAHALLYRTRFGGYIFALGGNREALLVAGLPVRSFLVGIYMIGGAMAGLAALLMTARMNAGHPTVALGMEFEAIAAAAVGGTSFSRGNGTLFGTLMGVVTLGVLRNGLNLIGVGSSIQVAAVGGLVILALLIEQLWNTKS